jgi:hypothetical protein
LGYFGTKVRERRHPEKLTEGLSSSVHGHGKLLADEGDHFLFGLWGLLILHIFFKSRLPAFQTVSKIGAGQQSREEIGFKKRFTSSIL